MRFRFLFFVELVFASQALQAQGVEKKNWEVEADTLMEHQDFNGALALYNKALETSKLKDKQDYSALYKRAVCYYSLGNFEKALLDINQFIPQYPDFPQAKLLKAFAGRELGDTNSQLTCLNDLLAQEPQNIDLLKWRSSVLLETNQYTEARKDALAASEFQDDPEIELYIGLSYYYQNHTDTALFYFEKSITLDSTYVPAYIYASSLCLEEERYTLALEYAAKGLQYDGANLTLMLYKGIAMVEEDKLDEGCRLLSKALKGGLDDAADYLKEYCYGAE